MCTLLLLAGLFAPSLCFGWGTYSTAYEDDSGYVHGIGVTDVTTSLYCCHTAYATTTLTSPTGQQISNWQSAHNYVSVDVQMGYAIGTWTVNTSHTATCAAMGTFINGVLSSATTLGFKQIQHNYSSNPLPNPCRISQFFDALRGTKPHNAEDVIYDNGNGGGTVPPYGTPVTAMEAGFAHPVIGTNGPASTPFPGCSGAPGNYIKIKSDSDGYYTIYFHVKPSISDNQHVNAGQVIGNLDNSGCQTKPHLHAGRKDPSGNPVNFTIPCVNPKPIAKYADGLVDDGVPDDL